MSNRTYYSREAEDQAKREQIGNTLLFILVGLAVGAVLALLFAPSSGEDTRDEIGSTVNEKLSEGRDTTHHTVKRLERDFADLRKKVEDRLAEMR